MTEEELREYIEKMIVKILGHGTHKDWFMELEEEIYKLCMKVKNDKIR
jgi:hypothetical protein